MATRKKIPQRDYWDWIQENIDVHAKGKPLAKIRHLRPNEPNDNLDWREMATEPITLGPWWEAMAQISGVLTNSTAQLITNDSTREFINSPIFDGNSLYKEYTRSYIDKLINQPNGLTVAVPVSYLEKHKVKPLQHIDQKNIYYIDNDVILWLSEEESEIEEKAVFKTFDREKTDHNDPYNQKNRTKSSYTPVVKKTIKKHVFNASTKDFFLRFEEIDNDYKLEVIDIDLGHNPAFQNGGYGKDVTGMDHVYYSYFFPAIAFGNLSLNGLSDFVSVRANAAFPHMWGLPQKCPGENGHACNQGFIYLPNEKTGGEAIKEPCKTCEPHGGRGTIFVVSPNKVHVKAKLSNTDHPGTDNTPLGFIEATPENVRLTGEFMQSDLQSFRAALCLFTKQGESAESGVSIGLQMSSMLAIMRRIGPQVFKNLEKIIGAFQGYVSGSSEGAEVVQPIQYGIASESVTMDRLFQSFKDDVPALIRQQSIQQFFDNYVGGNSPAVKMVELLELIDPFFYYSFDQKNDLLGKGGMTLEQYNISTQGFQAASLAIKENPELSAMELVEITKSKIISTAPEPNDDQLADASPEQLEAQARLRGSVGGVQGILAIQVGVSQGTTDYTAAIETLVEIYGFSREKAALVLGTPNNLPNPSNE